MQHAETATLGYGDLLQILRGAWMAVVLLTVAFGALAATAAFLIEPRYRAEVLLAPAASESGGGSVLSKLAGQFAPLSGLVAGLGQGEGLNLKEVRIATLRSRRLTEQFIRDRNLLPVLFPERWDASAGRWKHVDGRPGAPSMNDAVRLFDQKVRSISEDKRTGLVTLAIEWRDPKVGADWANDLVVRANEFLRARAIGEAQRSNAFLEEQLRKTSVVERQQIIYRLIESNTSEIMMANARKEFAFLIVDPAVAAEPGQFVWPRRGLFLAIGLILGVLTGIAYASVRWVRAAPSSSPA